MDLNNISKYMSLILRHKPDVIGIELDIRIRRKLRKYMV